MPPEFNQVIAMVEMPKTGQKNTTEKGESSSAKRKRK